MEFSATLFGTVTVHSKFISIRSHKRSVHRSRYITDKMPFNFWWIGFIFTAIPEAKIVDVRRDARATCWSNFKTLLLPHRGNGFAYDLQDVAEYYKMYVDLMAFWHQKFRGGYTI